MSNIKWLKSLEEAQKEVRGLNKLIFMFFHHPHCGGCKKTMEIDFNEPRVAEIINRDFAPVSFTVTEAEDMTARYNIEWTPTFILADGNGKELERWVGYLPPEDFISQIYLTEGLSAFHRNRFKEAEGDFEWIIDNNPDSDVAPEARYYMGVALYKESGDPVHLSRTWESMHKRYPDDYWTKKASAWS
ncbi:MAG: thioredoxin fold domain-containing protein [Deltaproteobacteria bacterium]|nr:thioredoxin fold domain-containing protein [Deltaproteobacteria bacterium]